MAVIVQMSLVFCLRCNIVCLIKRLGGACCFHLQGDSVHLKQIHCKTLKKFVVVDVAFMIMNP